MTGQIITKKGLVTVASGRFRFSTARARIVEEAKHNRTRRTTKHKGGQGRKGHASRPPRRTPRRTHATVKASAWNTPEHAVVVPFHVSPDTFFPGVARAICHSSLARCRKPHARKRERGPEGSE